MLQRQLGGVKETAAGVVKAIREILYEEDDILRLDLSRFWGNDELWDTPPRTCEAEDAEILLECYEQEVEAIYQVCIYTYIYIINIIIIIIIMKIMKIMMIYHDYDNCGD